MKSGKVFLIIILSLFFLISACEDAEDTSFSGLSQIISDKNKTRYEKAGKASELKSQQKAEPVSREKLKEEELLSIHLYEEAVEIVASDSKRKIAKGIAYINKQGKIVKIKIIDK
jgi:hypothetical protein